MADDTWRRKRRIHEGTVNTHFPDGRQFAGILKRDNLAFAKG